MKRLALCLGVCLLFAGCGGDKVVCTMEQEVAGTKMTMEITGPVKDGKISSATSKIVAEFKDEKSAKEYYETVKDEGAKISGKKVTVEEKSEGDGKSYTKKEFTEQAENMGFKCK